MKNAEIICAIRSSVGEGPLWDADNNRFIFFDIHAKALRTLDWDTFRMTETVYDQMPGTVALSQNGKIFGALEDGIYKLNPDGTKELLHAPQKFEGLCFNDGKVGPDGRFYVGTKDKEHGQGAFYRMDKDFTITKLFDNVYVSNGLAWTKDHKTLYYTDSLRFRLDAFDFDEETGEVSNRRTVMESPIKDGQFDGFTIDENDNLWAAMWNGGCMLHIDPREGKVLKVINFPMPKVTCCIFAGKELDELVVTTAGFMTDKEEYPDAGKVYRMKPGVRGVAGFKFGADI